MPATTAVTEPLDSGVQLVEMVPDQSAVDDGLAVQRMVRPDWAHCVQAAVEPRSVTPAGTVSDSERPPTTFCPDTETWT